MPAASDNNSFAAGSSRNDASAGVPVQLISHDKKLNIATQDEWGFQPDLGSQRSSKIGSTTGN